MLARVAAAALSSPSSVRRSSFVVPLFFMTVVFHKGPTIDGEGEPAIGLDGEMQRGGVGGIGRLTREGREKKQLVGNVGPAGIFS